MTRAAGQSSFAILASRLTLASSLAKTVTHTSAQRPDGSGVREFSPPVLCALCSQEVPGPARLRSARGGRHRAGRPRRGCGMRPAGLALLSAFTGESLPGRRPLHRRRRCVAFVFLTASRLRRERFISSPCPHSRKDGDQEKGSASVPGKRTSPEIPGRLPRPPPAHACVLARRLAGGCRCPARPVRSGGGEPGGGTRSVCHLASESSRS